MNDNIKYALIGAAVMDLFIIAVLFTFWDTFMKGVGL